MNILKKSKIMIFSLAVMTALCFSMTACSSGSQVNEYIKTTPVEYKAADYVKLGDYSAFDIKLTGDYSVSKADVKAEIEKEIDGLKGFTYLDKDKTEKGDHILVDVSFTIDGMDTSNDHLTDTVIVLGKNFMEIEGFDDELIGKDNYSSCEFQMAFPDDYEIEDYQGKTADFTVAINGIVEEYDMTYDKLDQSFVYRNFECESVKEYKEQVRSGLESQAEQTKESDTKAQIIEQLVDRSKIKSVPDGLIDLRIAEYKNYYIHEANSQEITLEEYLKNNDLTEEKWDEELQSYMKGMVNKELVYMAVADKEGISSDEDSYQEYLSGMKKTTRLDEDEFDIIYPDDYCRLLYCEEATIDYLYDNAKLNME